MRTRISLSLSARIAGVPAVLFMILLAQVRRALISGGRFDYDSAGDPDGIMEPLLNVVGF